MNSQEMTTGFRGERMRQLRRVKKISATQLSRQCKLTIRHIYRVENNQKPNVWAVTVAKLARALHTSMDYLMGLTDNPEPYSESQSLEIPTGEKDASKA